MSRFFTALLAFSIILGLSSCATTTPPEQQPTFGNNDPLTPARTAEERQHYLDLARKYTRLATTAPAPARQNYQLRAANILALGNFTWHARRILDSIHEHALNDSQRTRKRLLGAYIAILEHKPREALQLLDTPLPADTIPDRKVDYHRLRAMAFSMEGKYLHSARERVELEPLLTQRSAIDKNRQEIWQALSRTDAQTLAKVKTLPPPHLFSGWIELMRISKSTRYNSRQMRKQLNQWQTNFSGHPAGETILSALYEQSEQIISLHPENIALLLPLSGKLKPAGEAIRNGFIAAYYARQQQVQDNQRIHIYDVNSETDIRDLYQHAVSEGADLVVGPLDKSRLARLSASGTLTTPTLVLNYLEPDNASPPGNLFQLGLSPEDEARQAAMRMWADGYSQVGIIYPDTLWGQRVANAFIIEWEKNGNPVVATQSYDNNGQDFSTPVARLLKKAENNATAAHIPQPPIPADEDEDSGIKPPVGIDAVFMPGYPRQLRQLRPQMRFHDAGELPIYATSQVFTGKPDRAMDNDLNGIRFCDMPWILDIDNGNREQRRHIKKSFAVAPGSQVNRLYALGVDAYNVIPALVSLQSQSYERYDGETGTLMMDDSGRLHRQLSWAVFERGVPHLLPPAAITYE